MSIHYLFTDINFTDVNDEIRRWSGREEVVEPGCDHQSERWAVEINVDFCYGRDDQTIGRIHGVMPKDLAGRGDVFGDEHYWSRRVDESPEGGA